MYYLILSTIATLTAVVILYWLHSQQTMDIVVQPVPPSGTSPLISIIVPARNEAANIRRCVEALLAQDYPLFEAIVVDDRSTDATPAILRELAADDARLRILRGADLPDGWAGKPHALHQGAAVARGEWLCFVDADTFLRPSALSSTLATARATQADLFTMLTEQELGTFWEKAILPLIFTALSVGFPPRRANDPQRKDAIANGQFILIRRSVYAQTGGHAAIRGSIVEDKDLAVLVKSGGYRLIMADGRAAARTRMYTSLAGMWEGWTKNIFLGLRQRTGLLLLGAFGATLALAAALVLPLWPLAGLLWWARTADWMGLAVTGEAVIVWGYLLRLRARASHQFGLSGWYALSTPLGAAVFAAMMLASAWKVLSGRGVTWKGRTYRS